MKIKTKNKYCFASEFEAARIESGFTQPGVAKMLGRDLRTVKDWEAGKKPCPQWALRLVILESRYMEALYGLQTNRGRTGMVASGRWVAANDERAQPVRIVAAPDGGAKRSYMLP